MNLFIKLLKEINEACYSTLKKKFEHYHIIIHALKIFIYKLIYKLLVIIPNYQNYKFKIFSFIIILLTS